MRANPLAGLEREVLIDRHTPVVCRHDRHTGSMDIRRAEEVRDVLIVPVVKERLVLVALRGGGVKTGQRPWRGRRGLRG